MVQETKLAVDEEIRSVTEKYSDRLQNVEKEKSALVEKLVQRDSEIDNLSAALEEMKREAETQVFFHKNKYNSVDEIISLI